MSIQEKLRAALLAPSDEYDFDAAAEAVAASKGLIVVFPQANQLQLDIDSEDQLKLVYQRLEEFEFLDVDGITIDKKPSPSGEAGHWHMTLTFKERVFTEHERIMYQMALGSDPIREFLNARRLHYGVARSTRLFAKPSSNETIP